MTGIFELMRHYPDMTCGLKGVIPGISEDRGLRLLKSEDRRYDTLKYEEVETQEYQTNQD